MKKRKPISKLIDLIMAFAIFWLVIGDLITYHQVYVYGIDLFGNQNPFTIPKGKDDGKTSGFKNAKTDDETGYVDSFQISFTPLAQAHLLVPKTNSIVLDYKICAAIIQSRQNKAIPLRAPPTLA